MKTENRRNCKRNQAGFCIYYMMPCNQIPKDWDECQKS